MPFIDPLEKSGFKDPLDGGAMSDEDYIKKAPGWAKTLVLGGNDPDEVLHKKMEEYKKSPLQSIKDIASLDLPIGLIEQIPAGIQAGLGVASGVGNYALSGGEEGAYQAGKQGFASTDFSKALTPRSTSGLGIAGGIGATLDAFTEHYKDPENVKNILRTIPFAGDQIANVPEIVGVAGSATQTLPEILALEGAKQAVSIPKAVAKRLAPEAKQAPSVWDAIPDEKPATGKFVDPATYMNDGEIRARYNAADEAQVARLEAELARRNTPQDVPITVDSQGRANTGDGLGHSFEAMKNEFENTTKQIEAQKALDERQAQMEQEMARNQSLSYNAAERARQGNAPTGAAQHIYDNAKKEYESAIAEMQKAEQEKAAADEQTKAATNAAEMQAAMERQKEAQTALEKRQTALELSVKKQAILDFNAAERARQQGRELPPGKARFEPNPEMNMGSLQDRLRKAEEENVAWKQRGQEQLAENTAERSAYETQANRETQLHPLEEQLRSEAYVPVYDGQGPKTRAAKSMQARGQRGAVDISAVSDTIKKLLSAADRYTRNFAKADLDRAIPRDKVDFAKTIPGMQNVLDKMILRPESASELIAKGLKENDIPAISKDIAMGPEMIGEKYKNSLVAGVSKWLQWANKKGEAAYRDLVRPVEKTMSNLSPDNLDKLAEGLKREMFRKERFTDAELAQVLTPQLQKAYKALRDSFDTVYELQKRNLEAQGRRVPTKQEAYLASMRNGNYHVSVTNADGKPVWHVQARSRWEANKAVEWLKKNVPEAKNAKVDYRGNNSATNIPKDVLGAFQELSKLLDDGDMASAAIQDAIRKAQENAGYDFRNQSDRFLSKQNVRGFDGDMPWLSKKENAKRLLDNQIDYLKNAYDWAYMQEALGEVKDVLADPTLIKEKPNAIDYTKDVVRQQLGMADQFTRGAEEYIMSRMGLSRALLNKAAGATGRWTSLMQLGGSIGYMIATPLTALYSMGLHAKEGTFGIKSMSNALLDSSAGIVNNLLHDAGKSERMPMTALGRDALKYAEDNGIIVKNMFSDLDQIAMNPIERGIRTVIEPTITFPEKLQRLSTFMSFVHGLKEKGTYTNMHELFQRAETLTNIAATNFRSSELPMGVQKFGALGAAAFKYKAPLLNYYHQLHMNALEAGKGNVKPLLAFLGITAVLGGVQNLPGINEIDGAWNWIKKGVANFSPENYDKVKDVSVKGSIQDNLPEAVAFGAVQSSLGAQMSQRFGTDLGNLESPLENAFPVASMIGNAGRGVADLAKGNFSGAAWDVAPPLGKGLLEANADAFKAPNRPGGYVKPSEAGETANVHVLRNENDLNKRRLGLRSTSEAAQLETRARENKEAANIKTASDKLITNLVNKASRGERDSLDTYAKGWVKLNPDGNMAQAISAALRDSTLSPEEQKLVSAKSIDAIQRAKRVLDKRH